VPQSPPVVREALLTAVLRDETTVGRVEVARIELAPAQAAGLHLHPCDVVGCVLEGTIRFQVEGSQPKNLAAGDAFFEPANERIPHFDNASDQAPAVFVAFYLLPPGEDRLIVML
jgi:quercetin dioxygenase-like cupin family protein